MQHDHTRSWWRTRTGFVVISVVIVAAFYVLREHYGHITGAKSYILLLLFPLMHLFMHGGHGGHGNRGSSGKRGTEASRPHRHGTDPTG